MIGLLSLLLALMTMPFKSKSRLEAANAALWPLVDCFAAQDAGLVRLTNNDRWFFIQLYRWFPSILNILAVMRPQMLVRWHRAGFRYYWRWKSRPRAAVIG